MTTFNVGDIVQLNSGGPPLTVTEVKAAVKVAWIGEDFAAREAFFPAACLRACVPLVNTYNLNPTHGSPYSPPINFTVSIGGTDDSSAL